MKILTRALLLVVLLGCLLAVDTPRASGEPTKKNSAGVFSFSN